MDLDQHAAEAAARLHDQLGGEIDTDSAYGRVMAGVGRRRVRTTGVRAGIVAQVAVLAVGAVSVIVTAGGGGSADAPLAEDDGDGNRITDVREGVIADDGLTARGAAILGGLPDGPLDGRESWRLPVVADRSDDLQDGDQITLYGKGFEPGELVGAVHCSSEADTASAGVGACDLGDEGYAFANTITGNARFDGSVVISVPVRRYITTPEGGEVDCASLPERCLLAIGAAENYDRSGGTYINFADAPPFPEPVATLDPAGPYTPGQQVTVSATGLMPSRPYQVLQCAGDDHCASLSQGRSSAEGTYGAVVAVGSAVVLDGVTKECDGSCTLMVTGVGLADATNAPFPEPIPIELLAGDAPVGSEPPVTAPPDPGTAEPPPTTVTEPAPTTVAEPPPTTVTEPVPTTATTAPDTTTTTTP
jgi:hypothetical protein